jgi:hypothetical protein
LFIANRQEVGKILTASGPVLDSWKMFAGQMGLESADIKGIERDLLTKSIKLSEVFDEVLAVAEVRLKPCNIASVKKALVWMGYKGVEGNWCIMLHILLTDKFTINLSLC